MLCEGESREGGIEDVCCVRDSGEREGGREEVYVKTVRERESSLRGPFDGRGRGTRRGRHYVRGKFERGRER